MSGYMGKLLVVDLTSGHLKDEPLNPFLAHSFSGGAGYAARYLYPELTRDIDPLGPENPLMFMTGPLVGTRAPSCGRHEVCTLSPLTGIWAEANSGGFWGAELKFAGYDGIVVRGSSEKPVWLSIVDGQPLLHDAGHLWGLDCYETQQRLRDELADPKLRVASIGPAGENLVLYASIMNDHGRAAARCGVGAVMGSKKLKAIAVRGSQRVPLADEDTFAQVARQALKIVLDDVSSHAYHQMGTTLFVDMSIMWGNLPGKYWTQASPDEATVLSGPTICETILKRAVPCYGCAVACGREVTLKETPYGVDTVDGPEYESVALLGSSLLIHDLPAVAYANHLCNRFGMDTISAGSAIGLAFLMYDRGILTAADTGGLPLKWGDAGTMHLLLEQIALRQGFGDLLAQGSKRLAARFGAEDLAVHVNGLDLPAHDPRAVSGMGLVYATSPRGACHMQGDMYAVDMGLSVPEVGIIPGGRFRTRGKAPVVARIQDWRTLFNSIIMCEFVNPTAPLLARLLSAATGLSSDLVSWQRTGERIFTLKRALNNRLGVCRGNDRLPQGLFIPKQDGSAGRTPRMEQLLADYYAVRQWDWETGKPRREKLISLGLADVAEDLWPV
jgi:aldehyde:ferredoxin oxidoreductase